MKIFVLADGTMILLKAIISISLPQEKLSGEFDIWMANGIAHLEPQSSYEKLREAFLIFHGEREPVPLSRKNIGVPDGI